MHSTFFCDGNFLLFCAKLKKMKKICLAVFMITAMITGVTAQQNKNTNKPVRFLLGGALELGGDKVAEVYFTDGSTQFIRAGQGGTVFAGAQFRLNQKQTFFLRSSTGIKYVTTKADNAHIRLTRIPFQLTANYISPDKIRLAAGLVTHQAIRLNFDGLGENAKLTSSPGLVLEAGYGAVALSYTLITYKDKDSRSYAAYAIGITLSGVL
jgi:hypothetical protein